MIIARRRRSGVSSAGYFDDVASGYLARYSAETPGGRAFRERKERVVQLLGDARGRVLDVGCGPGIMAGDLAGGCTFVGADAARRMAEEGRRRFRTRPDIAFMVADAGALPCADASFDIVLCIGVIDRVEQPALAVAEMSRVLRPGGTLLISFPNLLSPYAAWRNYVFLPAVGFVKWGLRAVTGRNGGPTLLSPARLWSRRRAMCLLTAHVGRVEETAALNFNLLPSPLDELLPVLAMEVAERAKWLRATRLRWLGAAFLARVTKMEPAPGTIPVGRDPRWPRPPGADGGGRAE